MPAKRREAEVKRLAYSVMEACDALGVGHDLFTREIAPHLRIVRVGRAKLIAVTELQRWLDENGMELGL